MRGAAYADALVSHDINRSICVKGKAVPRVGAQLHFMMAIGDAERLREFART
jgi:hypothetical protein